MLRISYRILLLAVAISAAASSQRPSRSAENRASNDGTLRNPDIIEMVRGGLPSDIILAKISESRTAFDVSTAGLIALHKEKVPGDVIKAMMAAKGVPSTDAAPQHASAPATTSQQARATPSDGEPGPLTEPGIYMYARGADGLQLTQLEPTTYSAASSGGFLKRALTYGIAKSKTKAVIRGQHASIRIDDTLPVFYFVFPANTNTNAMAPGYVAGPTSPNEFTLIRLEMKDDSRETTTGSSNDFGASSGTDASATLAFTFAKLRPGVYKVTLQNGLEPGEYCFLSSIGWGAVGAGTAGANRLFDFSVLPGRQ